MSEQRYFEDIQTGQELDRLKVTPTRRLAVMFAGASGDFYEIHYDKDFAIAAGQPEVIVHGAQKASFIGQVLTNWMGREGVLKKLSCSFRGIDSFDVELVCNGRVKEKFVKDDEYCVVCELWIDNAKGERTTIGGGVVALPSREKGAAE